MSKVHVRVRRRAFTLVEMVVVIAIIFVLAGITFTVIVSATKNGKETTCLSNLRQIGAALRVYQTDYEELPPLLTALSPKYITDKRILDCPLNPSNVKTNLSYGYYYKIKYPEETFRDRPGILLSWENAYAERGELLPLVMCPFHNLNSQGVNDNGDIKGGTTMMVLRMDGSVGKSYKPSPKAHEALNWYDF